MKTAAITPRTVLYAVNTPGKVILPAVILSTTEHWERSPGWGAGFRRSSRPTYLPAAVRSAYRPQWTPTVVRPADVLCTWEEHLAKEEARRLAAEAYAERQRRHQAALEVAIADLNAAFTGAGLSGRVGQQYGGVSVILTVEEAQKLMNALGYVV